MGQRIAALDWSTTPVGSVEQWPQSLKVRVQTLLASQYPMLLLWGPHYTQFYNDAYAELLADKHPQALGQDCSVTLGEAWDVLGPMIEQVMETGVADWVPKLLVRVQRAGYTEEVYVNVSHSPAEDDAGRIVGMFGVCSEVTQQVIGERRLMLLHELAAQAGKARDVQMVCDQVAEVIARHPLDVPFALIYLRHPDDRHFALSAAVGLAEGETASPTTVDLDAPDGFWPLGRAADRETVHVPGLDDTLGVTGGPWDHAVDSALAMPIAGPAESPPLGVLIAGISPNRALNEDYRSFYELLAGQLSTAFSNARAYEQERLRADSLVALDRAKTAFFSNVSHEFRTPLTLMLGPTENALSSPEKALAGENLETVYRNELRLLKLVNTLLDFSRIEAGRTRAVFVPTDLAALTADLASNFRSAVERAGLRFVVNTEPRIEPVYVDRDMWENIVLNLLSNAFKFTFDGEIEIALRDRANAAELTVRDTGAGIAPEQLPHIFERFHRVEDVRSRTHEGSGIGLALVRELVKLHGGNISVESSPAGGTIFTVSIPKGFAHLPADQINTAGTASARTKYAEAYVSEALRWLIDEADAAPEEDAADVPEDRSRILLADDNADMRNYVARLLGERHAVKAVPDGAAALAAAQRHPPDLVLADVMMPGLNGFELVDALRQNENTRRVPVILLSARAGEDARIEGLRAGADDYLIKPFSARELVARVDNQLRMARLRRDYEAERQAVRARDQFLSIASHELNTPLAALRLQIALCKRLISNGDVPDRLTETLQASDRQVIRLARLVSKLLDVSRARLGRLDLKLEPCDLVRTVRSVVEQHHDDLDRAGITVDIAAPEPVVGLFDRARMEQVATNLVLNAARHAPGAPLTVTVEEHGDQARLTVRDEGPGVAEEQRGYLFGLFEHGEASRDLGGLGLGLYISRQIARAHGGDVRLLEDAPPPGACFVVELPLNP
ncbi:MAG TPA: ATP-binding protein [Gammaproteobacteria bacterium]|nr:ATP-binding protein [Gammaproteobacteria bacterium]